VQTVRRLLAATVITSVAVLGLGPATAQAAPATRHDGVLPNGATWIADVPANWNGTLLLYSHGYNPGPANPPVNSPDPATAEALLARGYALAGSSYSRPRTGSTRSRRSPGSSAGRAVPSRSGRRSAAWSPAS
jgi:hypothetical protein